MNNSATREWSRRVWLALLAAATRTPATASQPQTSRV